MAQKSIYEIKLYNEQTKRYHYLATMTAESPEEAKAMEHVNACRLILGALGMGAR